MKQVVLPLYERDIRRVPRRFWGLVPSRRAASVFGDKVKFARYVADAGLARHCPPGYARAADIVYPCVVKRARASNGDGCALVHSAAELEQLVQRREWRGRLVMQAFIPGAEDYVTHCVCKGGHVLWHRTYQYELGAPIRSFRNSRAIRPVATPPSVLAAIADLGGPLAYDGPLNVDYKLDASGAVRVFEINPRFGGSLMRPENVDDLRAALGCVLANSRWLGECPGALPKAVPVAAEEPELPAEA